MQYRHDERSGTNLSALGYGCMRLPMGVGGVDVDAAEKLILRALDLGVNYFDTAYLYPGSEDALGVIIERNGIRNRMLLATKMPHGKCRSYEDFDKLFQTSLKRLRTDHVDYYLIHNVVAAEQWQRLVDMGIEGWIAKQKASGTIRQMGFSFHGSLSEFRQVMDAYDWDFVQIQYNYINEYYQAGREGLMLAAERGLPVIIMEPLLGGKLANGLPKEARTAMTAAEPERSCAEWALRWLWDQPQVSVVLSGMGRMEQLEDNCRAASEALSGCLSDDERAVIAAAKREFEKSFKIPCTGCNYCMPCPKGINIPACFAAYNEFYSMGWFTGMQHYLISVGAAGQHPHLASDCVQCGACVKKCPQHINIPQEMRAVQKRMEFPGFRTALKIGKKILSK